MTFLKSNLAAKKKSFEIPILEVMHRTEPYLKVVFSSFTFDARYLPIINAVSRKLFILEEEPIENIQTSSVLVYRSAYSSDTHSHILLHTVTKVTY